jgi:DNA-binding response OmpR family regulator
MITNSNGDVGLKTDSGGRVKGRLLLIEDHPDIAQLLTILLEGKGYRVTVEPRCGRAAQQCVEQRPQVILLDLNLTEAGQCYAALRSNPQTKQTPLVLLTQANEEPQRLQAFELGPLDGIARLPHIQELLDCVKAALNPPQPPHKLRLVIDLCGRRADAMC